MKHITLRDTSSGDLYFNGSTHRSHLACKTHPLWQWAAAIVLSKPQGTQWNNASCAVRRQQIQRVLRDSILNWYSFLSQWSCCLLYSRWSPPFKYRRWHSQAIPLTKREGWSVLYVSFGEDGQQVRGWGLWACSVSLSLLPLPPPPHPPPASLARSWVRWKKSRDCLHVSRHGFCLGMDNKHSQTTTL